MKNGRGDLRGPCGIYFTVDIPSDSLTRDIVYT